MLWRSVVLYWKVEDDQVWCAVEWTSNDGQTKDADAERVRLSPRLSPHFPSFNGRTLARQAKQCEIDSRILVHIFQTQCTRNARIERR